MQKMSFKGENRLILFGTFLSEKLIFHMDTLYKREPNIVD